jgi:hypothetical protein
LRVRSLKSDPDPQKVEMQIGRNNPVITTTAFDFSGKTVLSLDFMK